MKFKKYILGLLAFSAIAVASAPTRYDDVVVKNTLSLGSTAAPDSKALLDIHSTTKGALLPRMTTTQRDAITSPPEGLLIYNTTTHAYNSYNASSWLSVGTAPTGTANAPAVFSSGGVLASVGPLTNGHLLVGSTGAAPVAASLTGTANQVVVTPGAGTITLSGPQSLGTGSSPAFTGLTVSGLTDGVVHSATGVLSGSTVVNADVSATAAIARTKFASGNNYRILANNSSGVMSENAALTSSRACTTDTNGQLSVSTTTAAEMDFVHGLTSAVQTQIDGKQPLDATLTALAAYNTNGMLTQTAADTFTARTITGTANAIDVSNGSGVSGNPTLSISSSAALPGSPTTTTQSQADGSTKIATTSYVDTAKAAAISASQPLDSDLTAVAALSSGGIATQTAVGTWTNRTITGTSGKVDVTNGNGVSGNPTLTISDNAVLPGTGSVTVPIGTTAQRSGSPVDGMLRYNSDTGGFEGRTAGAWGAIAGAGGGTNFISANDGSTIGAWATYLDSDAVTFTDAGDTVNLTAHGLQNGQQVSFTSITTTTGISANTAYYVVGAAANTFQVSTTLGGSAAALTTNGSGTLVRDRPVDGTGGSPSSTYAISTDTSLIGGANFLWTKSANNRMGEGFSVAFSIDSAYATKPMSIDFYYTISSGTFVSEDMRGWIFDVTNSALVEPSTCRIQAITGAFRQHCEFQPTGATSYRLINHTATVSASAYNLRFDGWSISPITSASVALTRPTVQKFTSGSGTYTTPSNPAPMYIRVRVVGAGGGGAGSSNSNNAGAGGTGGTTTFGTSLLSAVGGTGGTGTNTQTGGNGGTASLGTGPIGTAISGGKGWVGSANNGVVSNFCNGGGGGNTPWGGAGSGGDIATPGYAAVTNSGSGGGGAGGPNNTACTGGGGGGAGGYIDAVINSPASSYSYAIGAAGTAGTAGTNGQIGAAGGSGYIEVTEYYSGALANQESDGRVVAAGYYLSANQTPGTNTQINFDTKIFDTHNAVTTGVGAWKFTAPYAGYYTVLSVVDYGSGTISYTQLWKNGSAYAYFPPVGSGAGTSTLTSNAILVSLNQGDYIDVRPTSTGLLGGSSMPYSTYISIQKSTGSTIASPAEKILAEYTGNAGGSVTADVTNIDFTTKVLDTHNAWSGTVFTAPRPGWCDIKYSLQNTVANTANIWLWINGTKKYNVSYAISATVRTGTGGAYLNQGDTMSLRSDVTETLSNSATVCWVAVTCQ